MSAVLRDLRDTIVVLNAALVPGYGGQKVRDWGAASRVAEPANVQPRSTTELVDARQTTLTTWRVVTRPDSVLVATSRVEWDGGTYEVDGDVATWQRRGAAHHKTAVLKRVSEG